MLFALYGIATWPHILREENISSVFERRVLRKIIGHTGSNKVLEKTG
jgi:hypothetical protein